jgi:UDP:flavonoid glycosyltransferase YjiC (YdhE family)
MRVLVTTTPGLGHVHPVLPIARALHEQGNDVLWATGTDAVPAIEAAGIAGVEAGLTAPQRMAEFLDRFPESRRLTPQDLPAFMFPRLFADISLRHMLPDVEQIVGEWAPDVVLHEVGEMSAAIVAAKSDIPHVTHGFGARLRPERLVDSEEWAAPFWETAGLTPREQCGAYEHLYLDIYPPCLDPGFDADVGEAQLLRPLALEAATDHPLGAWLSRDDPRPLVYVTFGTVFNATDGAFGAAIEALHDIDARVLVTVGENGRPDAFGALPDRFAVAQYVPQHSTLRHADLVVSHGGSGTFLATLARGLPQCCLPQAADQFNNAFAGAKFGASIAIEPQHADGATIAAAIETLLADGRIRERAKAAAIDIASMPSPEEVATIVTDRFSRNEVC